jgi:hypothetical protein
MENTERRVEPQETLLRLLLTVFFALVTHLVNMVLWIMVVFSLGYALITQKAPSERVRHFANRAISYLYRVLRYLTYNESQLPFPFADLPTEIEPSHYKPSGPSDPSQGGNGGTAA